MKKTKKLGIKKVTLRDLDEPSLDVMAGGTNTRLETICFGNTCVNQNTCLAGHTCITCVGEHTCVKTACIKC